MHTQQIATIPPTLTSKTRLVFYFFLFGNVTESCQIIQRLADIRTKCSYCVRNGGGDGGGGLKIPDKTECRNIILG